MLNPAIGYIDGAFWRKARKAHRCHGYTRGAVLFPALGRAPRVHAPDCPREIRAGDRYIEYLGEAAAHESGHRYTVACADRGLKDTGGTL